MVSTRIYGKAAELTMWRRLMVITGSITLCNAVAYWFFFPDSPTNAWFLTPDERAKAVQRIKVSFPASPEQILWLTGPQGNQTGVENKHFKPEQYVYPCASDALPLTLPQVPRGPAGSQDMALRALQRDRQHPEQPHKPAADHRLFVRV